MSRQAVERLVGKLMTDDNFRNNFFNDVQAAAHSEGFHLTPEEVADLNAAKDVLLDAAGSISNFAQGPGGAAAVLDIHIH